MFRLVGRVRLEEDVIRLIDLCYCSCSWGLLWIIIVIFVSGFDKNVNFLLIGFFFLHIYKFFIFLLGNDSKIYNY